MKTKSGILELGKKEREALKVIVQHTLTDISYDAEGTFNKEGKNGEFPFDEKEAAKAKLGIEVIKFVLGITE